MAKNDLHSSPMEDDLFQPYSEDSSISDILRNILPDEDSFYEDILEDTAALEDDAQDIDIDDPLDTYQDSGAYRSYDGNREYRSFDASLPDAPEDEWYPYSQEDLELEEDGETYEEPEEPELPKRKKSKDRHKHPVLSIIAHALLVFFAVFAAAYLVAIYSNNSVIAKMRTMYIQTAMSSLNHKWMATAIIPGDIIDDVLRVQYETDTAMAGLESSWGTVEIQELPSFAAETVSAEDSAEESEAVAAETEPDTDESVYESADEQRFFEIFWELDYDSVKAYMAEHPEALADGWSNVDVNESGLSDEGTTMETIYGDQVLAVNAKEGVMLARVYLSSNKTRGVLAICKDTSRLSLCAASTLGVIGQTAGRISDDNNGLVAITASAFIDPEGVGNGGELSGLAVCSGTVYGTSLTDLGAKRLELREDNKMYIVDAYSAVTEGTRDASEFQPALIIDGEVYYNDGWNSPNPRVVLGQTSRLETIMVASEGSLPDSLGAGTNDIALVMQQYGCVQALNMDGGTSAMMTYKGEPVIRCRNTNLPEGRTLPTAWVYHYSE
jgi:exopolysaccharide biosynthesis protein